MPTPEGRERAPGKDQTRHHQTATIATSVESRLNSNLNEPEPPFLNIAVCPKAFEDGHSSVSTPRWPQVPPAPLVRIGASNGRSAPCGLAHVFDATVSAYPTAL